MSDFPFAKTERATRHCSRIQEALIRFCGKSESDARRLIMQYWDDVNDIEEDEFLYREPPYFYAMCIAHHPMIGDNYPEWYKDQSLWPPPAGWETT